MILRILLGSACSVWGASFLALTVTPVQAQLQIRLGDPRRANYSELHEALREGTAEADSVSRILREKNPQVLWKRVHTAFKGKSDWDRALIALTRIAELGDPGSGDSAAQFRKRIQAGTLRLPPHPGSG